MNFCEDYVAMGFVLVLFGAVVWLLVILVKKLISWLCKGYNKRNDIIEILHGCLAAILMFVIFSAIAFVSYWILWGIGWLICQLTALL
jgi:hypothetical protein